MVSKVRASGIILICSEGGFINLTADVPFFLMFFGVALEDAIELCYMVVHRCKPNNELNYKENWVFCKLFQTFLEACFYPNRLKFADSKSCAE